MAKTTLLRNHLLEGHGLPARFFLFIGVRSTRLVTSQPLLPLLSVTWADGVPSAVRIVLGSLVIDAL